ncbi:amino acid ABC transporter permease [Desulfovibrio litoralis]|uniref:Putative glutamine transport system permease protein GlnP n=1 Tax=Desulfovibrio litoralis DSM 11393 TaxID=1121455 RepID=A0A1M7TAN9_9BACT|nr:amino acid ABC transporter permease [Desulfovibrio litoralis]SHN67707.1 amino acid ABC transporter membrane protein, PAAT family [Desulfovibrio litoralis DSM 11393]
MKNYRGLDAPKGPWYYRVWGAVFALLVCVTIFFIWKASTKIDYVWHWERVPAYFWTNTTQEVRSDFTGNISEIRKEGNSNIIVLKNDNNEVKDSVAVPADATLHYSSGDSIYQGDVLASFPISKPGVLLQALWLTLWLSVLAILIGMVLGLLTGLARVSENPALRWGAITYIELVRGSPLLVQMYLLYFVAGPFINYALAWVTITYSELVLGSAVGVEAPVLNELWFGVLALAVFAGAYVAEIVRAGIQSVSRGQMEAARSLGMSYGKAMHKIILPQAFRRILPPLAGQFISLIKDSSLLGVITVRELTKATRDIVSSTAQPFEFWLTCAFLYLILTFTLSLFVQYLERKAVR